MAHQTEYFHTMMRRLGVDSDSPLAKELWGAICADREFALREGTRLMVEDLMEGHSTAKPEDRRVLSALWGSKRRVYKRFYEHEGWDTHPDHAVR